MEIKVNGGGSGLRNGESARRVKAEPLMAVLVLILMEMREENSEVRSDDDDGGDGAFHGGGGAGFAAKEVVLETVEGCC